MRIPDLRFRILFTLAILIVFRFTAHLPVPGVDRDALAAAFEASPLLGFLDLFSGGALSDFSIAALGVYPYITSSIVMQILVPVVPSQGWIDEIRSAMPMLPRERRSRLAGAAGVQTGAAALTVERGLDDLAVDSIGRGADAARVLVHIENNLADGHGALTADSFAALVAMETGGDLTATQAKTVLADLVESGGDPAAIAATHGFEAMDTSLIEELVDDLIATGGSAGATVALVEKLGAEVVGFGAIIELSFLDGRSKLGNIPVESLLTFD